MLLQKQIHIEPQNCDVRLLTYIELYKIIVAGGIISCTALVIISIFLLIKLIRKKCDKNTFKLIKKNPCIKNFNFNPSIIKRVKYEILKFNSSYWNNVYFDRDTVSSNLLNEKFYNLLKEIKKQNFIYNSNLELKFLKELKLKLNIENWKIIWLNFQCKNWERSVPFSEYLFNN